MVKTSYRVVNDRDLVAHYPPEIFGFYHHVPREIWFSNGYTNFTVCDTSGEDPTCSDSLDFFDFSDHIHYLGFTQTDGHQHGCGN